MKRKEGKHDSDHAYLDKIIKENQSESEELTEAEMIILAIGKEFDPTNLKSVIQTEVIPPQNKYHYMCLANLFEANINRNFDEIITNELYGHNSNVKDITKKG